MPNAYTAADVDKSGKVAIKDATYIQMFLAEMDNHAYTNTYVNVGGNDPTQPTQPTQPTTPTQPAGTRTIYFDATGHNTTTPYIYVWKKGTNQSAASWPGQPMTNVGGNIYMYTCLEEYNCCIFSRDGGNDSKITGDLEDIPYTNALYRNGWTQYDGGTPQ